MAAPIMLWLWSERWYSQQGQEREGRPKRGRDRPPQEPRCRGHQYGEFAVITFNDVFMCQARNRVTFVKTVSVPGLEIQLSG